MLGGRRDGVLLLGQQAVEAEVHLDPFARPELPQLLALDAGVGPDTSMPRRFRISTPTMGSATSWRNRATTRTVSGSPLIATATGSPAWFSNSTVAISLAPSPCRKLLARRAWPFSGGRF